MRTLTESPVLRLFLAFSIGILLFSCYANYITAFAIISTLIIGILVFLHSMPSFFKFKNQSVYGVLVFLFVVCVGYNVSWLYNNKNSSQYFEHFLQKNSTIEIVLKNVLQEKEKTYKAECFVEKVYNNDTAQSCIGLLQVYFEKSEQAKQLHIGQHVLIHNTINPIRKSSNPGSFNYAQYCGTNNLFASSYVTSTNWVLLPVETQSLSMYFNSLNSNLRTILKKYIADTSSLAIAEALLIGYRQDIDNDLWQAYSSAGIAHIIAISGMHVGILYTGVFGLCCLIPFFKKRTHIAIIISLLSMWFFVCITGLPSSIVRAAVMFTVIGIGNIIKKDATNINTLFASGLLLLCIQPTWLFDVGFQLSFAAVLSLFVFYKPIYHSIYVRNYVANKTWQLISSTLAAQIFTFPICLYYFHQFPLLFLITNFIAIPLTFIVLYAEIFLVFISSIPFVAKPLGVIIDYGIRVLNWFVVKINTLSFINWNNISINTLQLCFLILFVASTSYYFFYKNYKSLVSTLCTILLLLSCSIYTLVQKQKHASYIVYDTPKISLSELQIASSYYTNDDSISKNNMKYVIQPSHIMYGCNTLKKDSTICSATDCFQVFSYNHKKIIALKHAHFNFTNVISVDYLVLSNNSIPDIIWLQNNIIPKQLILDASIPLWKIEELKNKYEPLHIPIYAVAQQGAFVADL